MTALTDELKRLIAAEGPIPVARFMAEALSHPTRGYYVTRDPLGRDGDFVTAPEVSQMFGELIGLWCIDMWRQMGAPSPLRLIELGPGRGTLMADALRAARMRPDFLQAVDLHLIDVSPVLRQAQQDALAAHMPQWHGSIDEVDDGPAVIIANEFFDALPIRQYQRQGERWYERMVTVANGALAFTLSSGPAAGPGDGRPAANDGDIAEVSLAADAVMRRMAVRLAESGGAALIIDYGHAGDGLGDTLQAVRKHRYAPVLDAVGDADLTAHVDFAALSRAAVGGGAQVHGPAEQGDFLNRLGIGARAAQLKQRATTQQLADIDAALERLTGDAQMGRLFKVLAVTSDGLTPSGFQEAA